MTPDDGSGVGGYVVLGNAVTLLYPAGSGETVTIDVWEAQQSLAPPGTDWWNHLPTILPLTPGILWNNGGVVCVS